MTLKIVVLPPPVTMLADHILIGIFYSSSQLYKTGVEIIMRKRV